MACVGAGVYYTVFSRMEINNIDGRLLHAQGELLGGGLSSSGNGASVHLNRTAFLDGAIAGDSTEVAVLDEAGVVLDQTEPLPPTDVRPLADAAPANRTAFIETTTLDGAASRALTRRITLPGGGAGVIVITHSLTGLDDALRQTAVLLVAAVLGLTLMAAASAYWLSGRALRPVRAMAATARELSEHSLHRRIDLDLPDDEIGELAQTFNAMLTRLESAFGTLTEFTADAAHELRTPLAVIRAEAEVTLARARTPTEYCSVLERILAEAERLGVVADQLLTLARADSGALVPRLESIDVPDLLQDLVDRWRELASARGVTIWTDLPPTGSVTADPAMIGRLVDNLVDNALRFAPHGGKVTVSATVAPDAWTLTVEDTGAGVDAAVRPHLFERFTARRSEPRSAGGSGLGLSICAIIARVHAGRIWLDDWSSATRFTAQLARRPAGDAGAMPPAMARPRTAGDGPGRTQRHALVGGADRLLPIETSDLTPDAEAATAL